MTRLRSEYRLTDLGTSTPATERELPTGLSIRAVHRDDHETLAVLMLAAYRGTADDEGEDMDDARGAIDEYFEQILWPHSFVVVDPSSLAVAAMSLVVVVGGVEYIDPVATTAARKGQGLGSTVVVASLRSMAAAGITTVGAVITDGNVPSERLFAALRFERVGAW